MESYEFKLLINGIENLPKELLNYNSVLYRIYDKATNKNYIGTAKYGIPGRLYDRSYGHVIYLRNLNKTKCRGMYFEMSKRIEDFSLIIEKITESKNYEEILLDETELIIKYDSVLSGYNVSIDGKPGWKQGTICVNDGKYDLYIYPQDIDRYINNGFSLGSCKHDFLKGFIWINNGSISKMIDPDDFELFKLDGFVKGSLVYPNKGKIWVNDGKNSKLINKDKINTKEFENYKFYGRLEGPRKPRGKYNSSKKRKIVNNGEKELRVLESELESFLKDNPSYILGRLKGKILVSNKETNVSKFISKDKLNEYLSKGFTIGRTKK